tara:strand:- start:3906 stop:5708 length:1803 start_codon:yes stop_codon:yes gene_type:complete
MAQDYTVDIKVKGLGEAANQLAAFTDELNAAREEGASVSGALDMATGGAVSGFKKAATGVQTFIKGLKMTRAALIATGIGAFVVLVGSLISAFTKTRKATRALNVVFAQIQASLDLVFSRMQAVGGFIVRLFTKGHTAAAAAFREEMDALPGSIAEAQRQAKALEKATQDLTDAQRALTVQRAKDRAEIKEQNMIAEDTTRTLEEREAAAQKAIDIEKGLMAERERIAAEELRIAQEKADMSDSLDDDLDRLAELEANLINIRTESVELQTTLNNKLNTIRNEAARKAEEEAKRIADAAAEKAKAEADAAAAIVKAEQEVIDALDARDRQSLDARTKEILALEDFYNAQLDKAGENAELVAQIEAQREQELADMRERFRVEDAEKAEEARLKKEEAEKAATEKALEAQQKADEEATAISLAEQERREQFEEQHQQQLASLKESAAAGTFSILKNLTAASEKDTEEGAKKAFKRNQAISVAETLVNTYMAAQKAYASQILPGDPTSPVRATIAAGIAVASGLANVAKIKSQKFTGGGSTDAGTGGGGVPGGGGVQSVGVDVGSLVPTAGQETPEPVRAYVVSNEISNKQALDRELQIQTTL